MQNDGCFEQFSEFKPNMTATSLFDSLTSIAIVDRSADVAFLMSISVPWCGLSEAYFPLFDGGCLTDKAHKYSDATDPHGEYLLRNLSNSLYVFGLAHRQAALLNFGNLSAGNIAGCNVRKPSA